VSARDSDHMATLQNMFSQPLRAAGVGQSAIQNGFHQRELGAAIGQARTTNHVANHEHIGLQGQLVGVKAFHQVDAQCAELVAHGGVNAGVAAGDFVPSLPRQCRQATHESAANTEYVNMHVQILGGRNEGKIGGYGKLEIGNRRRRRTHGG
jgi:hypothetical protein